MLQLQKELSEQEQKLERAGKQNAKLAREIRAAQNSKGELPEEVTTNSGEKPDFIFFVYAPYCISCAGSLVNTET